MDDITDYYRNFLAKKSDGVPLDQQPQNNPINSDRKLNPSPSGRIFHGLRVTGDSPVSGPQQRTQNSFIEHNLRALTAASLVMMINRFEENDVQLLIVTALI